MTDQTTRRKAEQKTSPEQLRALRSHLAEMIAFVRSREATQQYADRSFAEIIQAHVDNLVGVDGDVSQTVSEMLIEGDESSAFSLRRVESYGRPVPTRLAQIERLLAKKDKVIAAIKRIDPATVNTSGGGQDG